MTEDEAGQGGQGRGDSEEQAPETAGGDDGPQPPEEEDAVEEEEKEETYEYSEDQVREMRKAFKKYDEFDTETIPVSKLGPVLRALALNPSEHQLMDARRWLGTDTVSGVVRFREFLIIMGRCLKEPITVVHVLDGFRRLDEKKEGVVGKQQLREVLTATGEKLTPYEFAVFMKYADPRHKGVVKYETFVTKMDSGQIEVKKKKRRRRKKGKKKKKKKSKKREAGDLDTSSDDGMTLNSELSVG